MTWNHVLSLAAIVLSAFTLYWSVLRIGRIQVHIAEYINITYRKDTLRVIVPMVLHNTGAWTRTVVRVVLIMEEPEKDKPYLLQAVSSKVSEGEDQIVFHEIMEPVSVGPRSSQGVTLAFAESADKLIGRLNRGDYECGLLFWLEVGEDPIGATYFPIHISEDFEQEIWNRRVNRSKKAQSTRQMRWKDWPGGPLTPKAISKYERLKKKFS